MNVAAQETEVKSDSMEHFLKAVALPASYMWKSVSLTFNMDLRDRLVINRRHQVAVLLLLSTTAPANGGFSLYGFLSRRMDFGLFITSEAGNYSFVSQVVRGLSTLSSLDFPQEQRWSGAAQ